MPFGGPGPPTPTSKPRLARLPLQAPQRTADARLTWQESPRLFTALIRSQFVSPFEIENN